MQKAGEPENDAGFLSDNNCCSACSQLTSIGRAKACSVLCQFIEPVTLALCVFIFALRNITLGGYLITRRNI